MAPFGIKLCKVLFFQSTISKQLSIFNKTIFFNFRQGKIKMLDSVPYSDVGLDPDP